eukprot:TRINITY_DN5857_c0_g1_i1.p1 TRINITY_DN5857_c0_g1~~TRINITY_DN5857_c0_g1_i1.p1  ORF type:complete len:396 (-),score=101.63 TRINITY_DN5857_c0_g1_i1:39-1226(-)
MAEEWSVVGKRGESDESIRHLAKAGTAVPKAGTAVPKSYHMLVAASLGNYPMRNKHSLAKFIKECPERIPPVVENHDNSSGIFKEPSWPNETECENLWAAVFTLHHRPDELRKDGVLFELRDTESGVTYTNPTLYAVVKKNKLNKLKEQRKGNTSSSNGVASTHALLMVIDAYPELRGKWTQHIHELKGKRVVVTPALIHFFVRCVGGAKLLFAVGRQRGKPILQSFGGHIEPIVDKNLVETAIRELKEEWRELPVHYLDEESLRKRLNKLFSDGESAHEITEGEHVLDPDRVHDFMHFHSFGLGRHDAFVSFKLDMTKCAGWSDCGEVERVINKQLGYEGEVIAATWVQASSKEAFNGASWTSHNHERATFLKFDQDSFDGAEWNEIHSLRLTE